MCKVSFLLPVYNGAQYLPQAIDSLLHQTYQNFEIIAVDDGSTDDSLAILQKYADKYGRVQILSRANTGIVGALNDGISQAKGTFIARMDADDWAHPSRLAMQLRYLESHLEVVACGTSVHFMDSRNRLVKPCPRLEDHRSILSKLYQGDGGALIHPSIMVRTEAIKSIGGYREKAQWVEDLDLYLRLSELGELGNLPQFLLYYRQHVSSVNATKSDAQRVETKNKIMREALARRNLSWKPELFWPVPYKSEIFRDWACESLGYGNWIVSLEYATRAVLSDPGNLKSWRTFKYVLLHGFRVIRKKKAPTPRFQVESEPEQKGGGPS